MHIQKTVKAMERGGLYLIATPIGNLDDITLRAINTLRDVDYILAEDTRVTQKLLQHLGIEKKLISFHEHNQYEKSAEVIAQIREGKLIGLVSDAGMPCISDPGAILVRQLIEANLPFTIIPGASASTALFAVSGMSELGHFTFHGFLPTKEKAKKEVFASYKDKEIPVIFYESPHRILKTLAVAKEVFAGGTHVCIGRELTKLHENLLWFTLDAFDAEEMTTRVTWKGEIAFIIKPVVTQDEAYSEKALLDMLATRIDEGVKPKAAMKEVATLTNTKTNFLYQLWEKHKDTRKV